MTPMQTPTGNLELEPSKFNSLLKNSDAYYLYPTCSLEVFLIPLIERQKSSIHPCLPADRNVFKD